MSVGRHKSHPLMFLLEAPFDTCRRNASAVNMLTSTPAPHIEDVASCDVCDRVLTGRRCCDGALDAGGRCCPTPSAVDEFGVCSGSSSSGTMVMSLSVLANAPGGSQAGAMPSAGGMRMMSNTALDLR